jgi:hypothetical protein
MLTQTGVPQLTLSCRKKIRGRIVGVPQPPVDGACRGPGSLGDSADLRSLIFADGAVSGIGSVERRAAVRF